MVRFGGSLTTALSLLALSIQLWLWRGRAVACQIFLCLVYRLRSFNFSSLKEFWRQSSCVSAPQGLSGRRLSVFLSWQWCVHCWCSAVAYVRLWLWLFLRCRFFFIFSGHGYTSSALPMNQCRDRFNLGCSLFALILSLRLAFVLLRVSSGKS